VLALALSSDLLMAPMFLNALAVAAWMLFKGVDGEGRGAGAEARRG
jgi:hypothetical protein